MIIKLKIINLFISDACPLQFLSYQQNKTHLVYSDNSDSPLIWEAGNIFFFLFLLASQVIWVIVLCTETKKANNENE